MASDILRIAPYRNEVDDAYTAWFNAHYRCTEAWRTWCAAGSDDRAAAYQAYIRELDLEELAAAELQLLQEPPLAA